MESTVLYYKRTYFFLTILFFGGKALKNKNCCFLVSERNTLPRKEHLTIGFLESEAPCVCACTHANSSFLPYVGKMELEKDCFVASVHSEF